MQSPGSQRSFFTRIFADERASVSAIMAIALPVLIGCVALAADVSMWMGNKSSIQGAADLAAQSAGLSAKANNNATRINNEALAIASTNGYTNGQNGVTVTVNHPPASGGYTSNAGAYEVIITQPQTLYFSSLFLGTAPTITGRAVVTTSSPCNSNPGGNDTGGASGTNFVLSNNETVVLPDMNGKTMHVSGYGTVQFSHDANGATLILDSSCIYVNSVGHDFNTGTFISNYTPPNMNKVSVAHSCNGCIFNNGSLGSGGMFAIGHDGNGTTFTFNTCASCTTTGQGNLALVE